jgi:diguanylate cyclase (GGDEF)-like protein
MDNTQQRQQTLLIVDDIPDNITLLLKFLTEAGFKVLVAKEGNSALRKAEYAHPDLILLDVMMPNINGFEVCKILKSQPSTQEIPIIFMTALSDTVDKIKGFSLGAVDYLTKPVKYEEALVRINTHIKMSQQKQHIQEQNLELNLLNQKLEKITGKLKERTAILEKANCELERLNALDCLTQIANRRRFEQYLLSEWAELSITKLPLSLIFADIDYFKHYNDHYGHQAGDQCLRQVAQAINCAAKRLSYLVARYGGEEFVVLLPNTEIEEAIQLASCIQNTVQKLKMPTAYTLASEYVSLSVGVSCLIPDEKTTAKTLVKKADDALYEAKKQGRNRVVCL